MITQSRLKEILYYNKDTGAFTWKINPAKNVKAGRKAGTIDNLGYCKIAINRKRFGAHQLAFLYITGEIPKGIDHINRNPGDNRWINLRPCTQSQNLANTLLRSNNKSGYRGVSWHKQGKKWHARIKINGVSNHLGLFDCKNEAYEAYVAASRELFGEFSSV